MLSPIVQVCDAISGARPGARREIVEAYIKRLNDLEQLAMAYPGVTKTYAIQAGRELRVIVGADKIDDKQTESLSGEIAKKIQDEMRLALLNKKTNKEEYQDKGEAIRPFLITFSCYEKV